MSRTRLAVCALSAVLLGQLAFLGYRSYARQNWKRRIVIAAGNLHVRGTESVDAPSLNQVITGGGTCAIVVVLDPVCGVCQQMRNTWRQRFVAWRDSLGFAIAPVWMLVGGAASARAFFAGSDLAGIKQVFVAEDVVSAARKLDLVATPTSYVFRARGGVAGRVVGDVLPAPDSVRSWCS